jgi:nucleotide-binding universal stress UspA family protein
MSNAFSRILVGVDDSEASMESVAFASRLAVEHGGQLIICHSVKAEGEVLLDRAVDMAKSAGVQAQRLALEGEPAKEIFEQAVKAKCSVIAMGTRGRQGLERLFVGSTMEAVLRGSTIPVLTVYPGTTFTAPGKRCFERIVVGVDESEPSNAALQTVLDLPPEDRQLLIFYCVASTSEDEQDQAHRVIGKAVGSANARGISAKGRVISGQPDDALIAAAQHQGADLIVLGSHGRRGLERFILGSIAEGVVRKSPLPVLVVRTREDVPNAGRAAAAEASSA